MAVATDEQVQQYANTRIRPRSEQIRALYLAMKDDKAAIDDVYAHVSSGSPTWEDNRQDAPAHLLTPGDVLAWNAFITAMIAAIEASAEYQNVLDACVNPLQLMP